MTKAIDLITGALRRINSYMPGEQLSAPDMNDALVVLNDMLDSWSTQNAFIYASTENVLTFQAGKFQYTIGPGGDFAVDNLTGAPIGRPLRITNAFTRLSAGNAALDRPITMVDRGKYTQIGIKNLPAPWPVMCWYNPTEPAGTLNFYQCPSAASELHLFSDSVLTSFATVNTSVTLPQGYNRSIKMGLARELSLEYGYPLTPALDKLYMEAISAIKALNKVPVPTSNYDMAICRSGIRDQSFILDGGEGR